MLIPHIRQMLSQPDQQPPRYQPPQINPQQAYGLARNPQMAPQMMEYANAPSQALYQQQTDAFKAAMDQKKEALAAGTSLVNTSDRANRARTVDNTIVGEDGKPYRVRDVMDSAGNLISRSVLGQAPQNLALLPSPQGYFPASRQTGRGVGPPAKGPNSETILPPPPAGVVQGVSSDVTTLGGLDDVWNAYKKIHNQTAGQGSLLDIGRQRVGTAVGETRLGGALAPDYARYTTSRRASLNSYIKSITGAQFSVKELERYDTQYPEPWDPEDIARKKIETLKDRATSDMQAKLRAFPAAGGQAARPRDRAEQLVDEVIAGH